MNVAVDRLKGMKNHIGTDQTSAIFLPEIGLEKFFTASTFKFRLSPNGFDLISAALA